MAKKETGIAPEKLAELITRIEALPIVEPAIKPTRKAIIENKAVFRAALEKGYTREQLVDMWNEYGSTIKEGTFAGYLRETSKTANTTKKRKSKTQKEAPADKSETHPEVAKVGAQGDMASIGSKTQSVDPDQKLGTGVSVNETKQIEEAAKMQTEPDEDAMVDAILARRNAAKPAGSGDG